MRHLRSLVLAIVLSLHCASTYALDNFSCCNSCLKPNWCHLGTAGFTTTDPEFWYNVTLPLYPTYTTISLNRNFGSTQGNVQLNSTGLTIGQPGNYWASYTLIIVNDDEGYDPPVYSLLVRNGDVDLNNFDFIGSVDVAYFDEFTSIHASGLLQNIEPGTTISLVASSGGGAPTEIVTVAGWEISLFKIPCDPTPIITSNVVP